MGKIYSVEEYHNKELDRSNKLVVFCNETRADENAESINIELAKELRDVGKNKRSLLMDKYVAKVLSELDDDVVIKNFDVLFNPDYKIDILKILIEAHKYKPFNVLWPGTFKEGKLVYAEEGYKDYKSFNIENYDIICVI